MPRTKKQGRIDINQGTCALIKQTTLDAVNEALKPLGLVASIGGGTYTPSVELRFKMTIAQPKATTDSSKTLTVDDLKVGDEWLFSGKRYTISEIRKNAGEVLATRYVNSRKYRMFDDGRRSFRIQIDSLLRAGQKV